MKADQWLIHCAPRWRRWTCPVDRTNQPCEHPDSSSAVPEPKSGWNAPPALLSLTERSKQLMNKQLIVLDSTVAWSRTADEQVTLETTGQNSPNQSSPSTDPAAEGLSPWKHREKGSRQPRAWQRHPPGGTWSGRCCLIDSPPPRWFPPSARTSDLGFQVALAQGAGSHRRTPPTLLFVDAISLSGTLCLDLLELHTAQGIWVEDCPS